MKKSLFTLILATVVLLSNAQVKTRSYLIDPDLAPREHNVNFTNMRLDVAFEPTKGLVKGKVSLTFTPYGQTTDSIWLDGINMTVKKLTLNGKETKYKVDSLGIVIYPTTPLVWESKDSLTVTYECNPRRGLYFIGWDDPNNLSRKQIWSQGEGTDNRNWIPMWDDWNDKMLTETVVTFDKDYEVLSNGTKLPTKDNKDGTKTWHYKMTHPQSPYLVMLGIGKYGIDERKSKVGTPIHLYYYPDQKDRVLPTYKYMPEMIDFYDKEIGVNYGWESYSVIPVQDFMYGAMENTTATVYGDFYYEDPRGFLDRSFVGVDAHELAHQWFGDMVTCHTSASMWLHENFATYYSLLFDREINGEDSFNWGRRGQQNAGVDEAAKNSNPIASSMAGSARLYPQGAFVLGMLKYVVGGREIYNKAIKHYLENRKYQNVDAKDLLNAFEESTGKSLDWFWEEWYYKGGVPNYNVSYSEQNGSTEFDVSQVQKLSEITGLPGSAEGESFRPAGLFKMPIWFEVHYTDGTADKKQVWIEKLNQKVAIANPSAKKIDYVLFDPNNEVMKSVTFTKPFDMLVSQAKKAESILDRYDALIALRSFPYDKKRDLLIERFNKENFWGIKPEFITQLANDSNPSSRAFIKAALGDKNVSIRKAALGCYNKIPKEFIPDVEKLLADSSYDIISSALDKLALSNPQGIPSYLEKTKGVIGSTGRSVELKWLEISYGYSHDTSDISKLIDYTSNSYEFRTRGSASQLLKRMDYLDTRFLANLLNAILSTNGRLSGPAGDVLQYFNAQMNRKKLISDFIASEKWEPWQLAAIKQVVN